MQSVQMMLALVFFLHSVGWGVCSVTSLTKCEPLDIQICKQLNYNKTVVPNFAKHRTQWEANQTIQTILPLINSGCSQDLVYLTCSYYAPVCTSYGIMVKPCRSLCRRVKKDCAQSVKQIFGTVEWPKDWDCKKLPKRKNNVLCFGRPRQNNRANSIQLSLL